MAETTPSCEWCGKAIQQDQDGNWYAVKGEERGYPPLACEASDDGLHDPGAAVPDTTPSSRQVENELIEAIAARREDKAFMARLAARVEADAPLLLRLSEHSGCSEARLMESRQGGTLLVYLCECGAKLIRTKEAAEQQAKPATNAPSSEGLSRG